MNETITAERVLHKIIIALHSHFSDQYVLIIPSSNFTKRKPMICFEEAF